MIIVVKKESAIRKGLEPSTFPKPRDRRSNPSITTANSISKSAETIHPNKKSCPTTIEQLSVRSGRDSNPRHTRSLGTGGPTLQSQPLTHFQNQLKPFIQTRSESHRKVKKI